MMTTDIDRRLANLLNANAPPERDPTFRIQVLARRERWIFRRRVRFILCALVAFVTILLTGYRSNASLAETASVVLFGISLGALAVYLPVFGQTIRRTSFKNR